MPTAFNGTLTGFGTETFVAGLLVPTDMDIDVTAIGYQVSMQGPPGHLRLTNVGWIQFFNSTFGPSGFAGQESVTEAFWFNSENQDAEIKTALGQQADGFAYWISPGSEVKLIISY